LTPSKKASPYTLGKSGRRPLLTSGLNPSTATQERLDPTATRVEKVAKLAGFDGFVMLKAVAELHPAMGTQQGGYDVQLVYDVLDFREIQNRRPYVTAGRQIDGTPYLVELKFTALQAAATDIDSIRVKVDDKADNTMGIMVSVSGYSSVAVTQASGAGRQLSYSTRCICTYS
jgi:hypothetical protein